MKVNFREAALYELYHDKSTSNKKYKNICRDKKLIEGYTRALDVFYFVDHVSDLRHYSFLHYEKLKNQGSNPRSSVRLLNGRVERLIFTETPDGLEVELIEIDSTHYGNKK